MLSRPIVYFLALTLPSATAFAFSPDLDVDRVGTAEPLSPAFSSPMLKRTRAAAQNEPAPAEPAAESTPAAPPEEDAAPSGGNAPDANLPTILRNDSDMPPPVRDMRQKLIEAAKSGDIERLRALMKAQAEPPSVAFGDPGDPIDYLKALSSDADGREILAILLEVLESGFVHVAAGTADELYVWPYFAQYPLDALTPPQLVELFTLLTATDYEDMKSYGVYTFFRVGIRPDGRWMFFLAGD